LRIAVITTHVGVPQTLASTAFISAIVDGFDRLDLPTIIVGLAETESTWNPQALDGCASVAPWLGAPPASLQDVLDAAKLGVLDPAVEGMVGRPTHDWYRELLLERSLARFAGGDELTVMVYPRSFPILNTVSRIVHRRGWRLMIIATEALIDAQIDSSTRNDYIRCAVESGEGVWALSEHLAMYWIAQGIQAKRVLVNPPAIRMNGFRTDPPPGTDTAAYVGNLRHKEIDYLLDISETVARTVPGYRLRVYGDATDTRRSELIAEIERRQLTNCVTLEQSVLPADVPQVLSTADVLVLPRARGEFSSAGFPNKLGEYLATGRPAVVTAVGDIPKYLTDRQSAYLVEPDDCAAFTLALTEALTDSEGAIRVGIAGRSFAERQLASIEVARRLVTMMESLPVRSVPEQPSRLRRLGWAFVPAVRLALRRPPQ
jgi:hypothetical protein